MHKRHILLLFLGFILSINTLYAQQKWTLEQCIDYAKSHNIQLKQALLNVNSNRLSLSGSYLSYLPSLSGSGSLYFDYGKTIDYTSNTYVNQALRTGSVSLGANMVLFGGLKKYNQLKQSQANLQSSQWDADKQLNDISLNMVSQFLAILNADEQLTLAKNQRDIVTMQADNVRKKVAAGVQAEGDLYTLESQVATEEVNVINALNNLDIAKLGLQQLLNMDVPVEISVPDITDIPAISDKAGSVDAVYDVALKNQPQIKSYELKAFSARRAIDINRGSYYPSISVFGSLSSNFSSQAKEIKGGDSATITQQIGYVASSNTPVFASHTYYIPNYANKSYLNQFKDNLGKAVGISISVPIFNGLSTRYAVEQSKITALNAGLSLDATKQQLKKDVQTAYANTLAAQRKYGANLKNTVALKKAFDYADTKYSAGLAVIYDYNNAKNNYEKAKSDEIYSKYDLIFKLKLLDYYLGNPLKL